MNGFLVLLQNTKPWQTPTDSTYKVAQTILAVSGPQLPSYSMGKGKGKAIPLQAWIGP
jgi:hypothetical protein